MADQHNTTGNKKHLPPVIAEEFIAHAKSTFLKTEDYQAFIEACGRPLRKSIRVNTLKVSVEEFTQLAPAMGISLKPIPWCSEGFWVEDLANPIEQGCSNEPSELSVVLGNLPEHLQGLFYIQEASSMLPPQALFSALSEPSGAKIDCLNEFSKTLDLAAAPGSKTTQIAALMNNHGLILANEISASRVKSLHANLVRCGVLNTCLTQFDGRKLGERLEGVFDFVLLDAPCGGEGTIRKDNKALQDWQLSKVKTIAELQKSLIETAYRCLKPGGKLVYSTCTLSPEENQQVVTHLLDNSNAKTISLSRLFEGADKAVTEEGYLHILPHLFDSEGFFVAAVYKPVGTAVISYQGTPANARSQFNSSDKKVSIRVQKYFKSHFGVDITDMVGLIMQRDKEIWAFPEAYNLVSSLVRLNRAGIKLAEVYPNKIRSSHEFSQCFSESISKQKCELTLKQAEEFYKGRNVEVELPSSLNCNDGEVILTYQGQSLGLGNLNKNKIKNLLPRDLVRDQIKFLV